MKAAPGTRRSRVKRGSTLRLELDISELLCVTMRLTCTDVGELFDLLMYEAAGDRVATPSNDRVQYAFDRRDDYRIIKGSFGRAGLPLALRKAVFERDSGRCTYCHQAIEWADYHCDHVEPVSKGGLDAIDNLTTSCRPCNLSKAAKPLSEWLQ